MIKRFKKIDWAKVSEELDAQGSAAIEGLLSRSECEALIALYADDRRFRSRIVMQRHGVSRVRDGLRYTAGIIFHDAA